MTQPQAQPQSSTTWSSGAGVVESVDGFVQSLVSDSEGEGVDVVDVALNGAGMVVDVVGAAANPLGALASAGVGWLLEHVSFLREPLDALLGNPDEINANTDQLKQAALEMKMLAREHRDDLGSVSDWEGESSEAFHARMNEMADNYDSLASTMDGTAAIHGLTGMVVCELRGQVFGWISDLIGELIASALIAAASAVVTFGGSVAAFAGYAGVRAAMMGTKIAGKLSKLAAALGRMGGRLAKLGEKMKGLMKALEKFSEYGGYAKDGYEAVKPYEMPPPAKA